MTLDPKLRDFAQSDRQREIFDAMMEHGSSRIAAAALGLASKSSINTTIDTIRRNAAIRGYSPEYGLTEVIAPGYVGRGHSTMYRVNVDTGVKEPVLTWVKTRADDEARQAFLQEAIAAAAETLPRVEPIAAPRPGAVKLCNLFTITDYHVGMLAWDREGGADWDLGIAEDTLLRAFRHMIATAPRARVAVVNQLGDYLHQDNLKALTPTSGHLLDADSRFRKIIRVAIRMLRHVIDMALATHDEVHVIMAEGNHDESSSAWLQEMFAALYENEPRVTVNDSALPYYVYQHGSTMLAFHHGHMKKNEALPLLFAAQYPAVWGTTSKRYAHVGHRHHVEEKEHSGMKVVQHATLAARDAYAARGGWLSERQAIAITYHEDHGEVGRLTVTPEMLDD